ncbi:hypothetical protein D9M71_350890 [compost metagenome]
MVIHAGRLDHRRSGLAAVEIELHVAGLVGANGDDIAPRVQGRRAATGAVGAQLEAVQVGLDVDDQPGLVRQVLTTHRRLARPHRKQAFKVHAAVERAVVGRALHIGIAMQHLALKLGVAAQADAIAVGTGAHADAAQRPEVDILLVGQRSVEVAPAVTRGAAAETGGKPAPAAAAETHAHTQVDPTAARVAGASGARAVEQRQAPVGVRAEQAAVVRPAQVDARALAGAAAVGQAQGRAVARVEAVIERQR